MVVNTEDQTREYMLSRAKACLQKGDPSYAKSWIMTANALFPQNDKIKMESYEMSKCEGNVEEAVKYLCEMFDTKQCEEQLKQELNKIVISCRNQWQTYHLNDQQIQSVFATPMTASTATNQFYAKLFGALSSEYQYKLLRRVSDSIEDRLVLIDLLLYILKKFPESVAENGLKLIKIIDESRDQLETTLGSNVNQYLKRKLIFEVLPLIFANDSILILDWKTTQNLMEKSLKYFVERLIACQTDTNFETSDSSHVQKDNDDSLEVKVKEIFQLIGRKNKWKLFERIDLVNERHSDLIYDRISDFINELLFTADTDSPIDLSSASTATATVKIDKESNQQILYATLLLFLHCLRKYSKLSSDYVLIEETTHTMNESNIALTMAKKRKLSEPIIIAKNEELKLIFVTASKALKLLQENITINQEFTKISETIGLNQCLVYNSFIIDSNLYRGEYNELLAILSSRKTFNIKANLQLISSSLMLHDCSATLKHCLDAVEYLPHCKNTASKDTTSPDLSIISGVSSRQLTFLSLTIDHIINYIIKVIILCLKEKVLFSLKPSDLGVGHLLVLSQYKWPTSLQLFLTCVAFIREDTSKVQSPQSQPKFSYPNFLNYIFIPDIIEEFMSMVEIGKMQVELKSSTSTLGTSLKTSSKIITTRGVNKGVKEENRSALQQQMQVSKTQIPNELFIEFINKEIRTFLASINK